MNTITNSSVPTNPHITDTVASNIPTNTISAASEVKSIDSPTMYAKNAGVSGKDVTAFMTAFSETGPLYSLIHYLNSELKSLHRKTREAESEARMKSYANQFNITMEKRDLILKVADKVHALGEEKAKWTLAAGLTQGGISLVGAGFGLGSTNKAIAAAGATQGLGQGTSGAISSKSELIQGDIDLANATLRAAEAEFDALIDFAKKQGELSGAHMSLIDDINSKFLQLVNELHSQHTGTLSQLGRA